MIVCWMAQAIPPPLVHRISLTFIWLVRTLPRFSPLKRSTSNYFGTARSAIGLLCRCSLPSILASSSEAKLSPLEEIIARAAVEALAMEVSRGLPGVM